MANIATDEQVKASKENRAKVGGHKSFRTKLAEKAGLDKATLLEKANAAKVEADETADTEEAPTGKKKKK